MRFVRSSDVSQLFRYALDFDKEAGSVDGLSYRLPDPSMPGIGGGFNRSLQHCT
jgi:hypothetical protein